jgi:hypothetical protein
MPADFETVLKEQAHKHGLKEEDLRAAYKAELLTLVAQDLSNRVFHMELTPPVEKKRKSMYPKGTQVTHPEE